MTFGIVTHDIVKHKCGCWGPSCQSLTEDTPRDAVVHPEHAAWHAERKAAHPRLPHPGPAESLVCGCDLPREPYAPMPAGAGPEHHQHRDHDLWHIAEFNAKYRGGKA